MYIVFKETVVVFHELVNGVASPPVPFSSTLSSVSSSTPTSPSSSLTLSVNASNRSLSLLASYISTSTSPSAFCIARLSISVPINTNSDRTTWDRLHSGQFWPSCWPLAGVGRNPCLGDHSQPPRLQQTAVLAPNRSMISWSFSGMTPVKKCPIPQSQVCVPFSSSCSHLAPFSALLKSKSPAPSTVAAGTVQCSVQ